MGKQKAPNPQSPPNEKLSSLGMEHEVDPGQSDLTTRAQIDQLMDNVANTIPDSLAEQFYKDAKVEADDIISQSKTIHSTNVFRLALQRFSAIANRLVRRGGK